jgi:hypothetical protein
MKVALAQKLQKDCIGMYSTLIDLKCLDPAEREDTRGI